MSISKNGTPLLSLADWETHAGPRYDDQWIDGRSAKEAAKAWLEGGGVDLPKEIGTVLKRNDAFGKVVSWSAEPEVRLPFDDFAGEPVVGDVVVQAEHAQGAFLISVDVRTDEPFGDTVADALAAAVEGSVEQAGSDGLQRIAQLVAALFGPRAEGDPMLKDIRYALLTACAGCLAEAERRGVPRALLLIEEFVTDRAVDRKQLQNTIDLGRFVKRLSHGAVNAVNAGEIHGPFPIPGAPLFTGNAGLYIGKVSRNTKTRRP